MINLEKGQRVNVEIPKFTIGLGWDTNESSTGADFDLDASAFICKHSKKCTFYTLRFGCSFAAVNTIKPQLL